MRMYRVKYDGITVAEGFGNGTAEQLQEVLRELFGLEVTVEEVGAPELN